MYVVARLLIFAVVAVIMWPDRNILFPVILRIFTKHGRPQPRHDTRTVNLAVNEDGVC